MAHGSVNVPGPSGLELQAVADAVEQLTQGIFAGEVTAALTCRDGTPLLTRAGEPILARKVVASNQLEAEREQAFRQLVDEMGARLATQIRQQAQELVSRILAVQEESGQRVDALTKDIMTGSVSQPLETRSGQTLTTREGVEIQAWYKTR